MVMENRETDQSIEATHVLPLPRGVIRPRGHRPDLNTQLRWPPASDPTSDASPGDRSATSGSTGPVKTTGLSPPPRDPTPSPVHPSVRVVTA